MNESVGENRSQLTGSKPYLNLIKTDLAQVINANTEVIGR